MTTFDLDIRRHFRRNFVVNVGDLAFWALGSALVSTATVLPLFISHLTSNPLIIGLVPSVQFLGWRLPQLFTGNLVERMTRKIPFVWWVSLNERIPFLMIGLFMLFAPSMSRAAVIAGVLLLLTWQAVGGGLIANAWQDMIAKVILPTHWGIFFGVGNAVGAVLGLGGAALSAWLLRTYAYPNGFAYSYIIGTAAFAISWVFLGLTHEPPKAPTKPSIPLRVYLRRLPDVVRSDSNFRSLILVRTLATFGTMGNGFLAVYGTDRFNLGDDAAARFTATMLVSQAILYPILGRLGDRRGHYTMNAVALWGQVGCMAVAAFAPSYTIFLLAFSLRAASEAISMTSGVPIVFQFCPEEDRPTYIGLANTLTAPPLVIAPILGGLLASHWGYVSAFGASAILGIVSAASWHRFVREPNKPAPLAS